eukprot:6584789-Alexandrium_andersonii.AAC.1
MLADGDLEIFASVPLPPTNDDHSGESEPRACVRAPAASLQFPLKNCMPKVLRVLLPVLLAMQSEQALGAVRDLACVEFFCGVGSVHKGFDFVGCPSHGVDLRGSPSWDLRALQHSFASVDGWGCLLYTSDAADDM